MVSYIMRLFSNTNWNLYRCFVTLYDAGNYTKAEQMLGVSRKNIRENIKTLSDQIGTVLFVSHRKGATPTSSATSLYPIIKNALNLIKDGEESLREFTSDSSAIIKMVIPSTILSFVFNPYFENFMKLYPNVKFEFYNRALQSSYDLLEQGKIDFVIDFDPIKKSQNLKTIDLLDLNTILVANKSFLTENNIDSRITKNELAKIRIIGDHDSITELETVAEIKINAVMRTATTDPIYSLVKNGFGIGIYYDVLFKSIFDKDFIEISVNDLILPRLKIVCGYRKHFLTKAAQKFVDGLIYFCENLKT